MVVLSDGPLKLTCRFLVKARPGDVVYFTRTLNLNGGESFIAAVATPDDPNGHPYVISEDRNGLGDTLAYYCGQAKQESEDQNGTRV